MLGIKWRSLIGVFLSFRTREIEWFDSNSTKKTSNTLTNTNVEINQKVSKSKGNPSNQIMQKTLQRWCVFMVCDRLHFLFVFLIISYLWFDLILKFWNTCKFSFFITEQILCLLFFYFSWVKSSDFSYDSFETKSEFKSHRMNNYHRSFSICLPLIVFFFLWCICEGAPHKLACRTMCVALYHEAGLI